MICVPAGVTQVERRAVLDATLSAGARIAYLIDEPLAAAIGAKVPIAQPSGNMVVDIGGGSTEAAVISLGGVVVHKSARVAGNRIDEAIQGFIKRKYNLFIGERTAEEIKITIGSALPVGKPQSSVLGSRFSDKSQPVAGLSVTDKLKTGKPDSENRELKTDNRMMEVRGRDAASGLPRMVNFTTDEVVEAITPTLSQIISAVKKALEETPPELASDVIDRGIVLSGGTALLRNFDKLMTHIIGVPVHVADDPLLCVVKGCGMAMENIDLYKRSVSRR
jgi:rod shape-determining protein MreB